MAAIGASAGGLGNPSMNPDGLGREARRFLDGTHRPHITLLGSSGADTGYPAT